MRLEPAQTREQIEAFRASLAGRKVAVIGAGVSGRAAVCRLVEAGAQVLLADAKTPAEMAEAVREAQELGARVVGGFERLEQLGAVDLIVFSPGVPREHPALRAARAAGVECWGTLELGYRLCPSPIVAVTGTNGKGTTCRLLSDMLSAAGIHHILAGNIGTPLADEVGRAAPHMPAVVEVSSFQLEGIVDFRPRIAALLNIAPDHLDRHPTMRDYIRAKTRIFENQRPEDFAIVNGDDEMAYEVAKASRATRLMVSDGYEGADAAVLNGQITLMLWGRREVVGPASDFPLRGRHLRMNLLVAAVTARLLGAPVEAIAQAARNYRPPEHHLQGVGEIDGVEFINDSKATNPAAATADLEAMDRPFVAIVGGKDKGADFTRLGALLTERARAVILIGEAAERIALTLGEVPYQRASTLEEAVAVAARLAVAGDAVIMAPACSSFDMFRDYAHRGHVFQQAVRRLAGEAER